MNGQDNLELRQAICEVGRRMYLRNLVAATDGNISVRLGPGRFLCTPSGVSKGWMLPEQLVIADDAGALVSGEGRVTSEFHTHLAVYEERADVNAVVHAHPPKAIGFSLAGRSMTDLVLPELVMSLGGIPSAPYATPGTVEGSRVVRELIRRCDAVLLDRHGAVTVGVDVVDAYHKMEKIEHAAQSLLTAHLLGGPRPLDPDEVRRLRAARSAYGHSGMAWMPED